MISFWFGGTQKMEFICKNCVFSLTCLNFSHLQHTLHLMQYTYWDVFSHGSKQFLNALTLMLLSAPAFFCFTSSTCAKCFLLGIFFIPETRQSCLGWDQVNRESGALGPSHFDQELLNIQRSVGRCAGTSWIVKWANALSLQKKIHWSWMQPLTTMPSCPLI